MKNNDRIHVLPMFNLCLIYTYVYMYIYLYILYIYIYWEESSQLTNSYFSEGVETTNESSSEDMGGSRNGYPKLAGWFLLGKIHL